MDGWIEMEKTHFLRSRFWEMKREKGMWWMWMNERGRDVWWGGVGGRWVVVGGRIGRDKKKLRNDPANARISFVACKRYEKLKETPVAHSHARGFARLLQKIFSSCDLALFELVFSGIRSGKPKNRKDSNFSKFSI